MAKNNILLRASKANEENICKVNADLKKNIDG